jgi:hypothetical protein
MRHETGVAKADAVKAVAHGFARITANEALIRRLFGGVHAKSLILNGEKPVKLILAVP